MLAAVRERFGDTAEAQMAEVHLAASIWTFEELEAVEPGLGRDALRRVRDRNHRLVAAF
jgi:hypothetical protein